MGVLSMVLMISFGLAVSAAEMALPVSGATASFFSEPMMGYAASVNSIAASGTPPTAACGCATRSTERATAVVAVCACSKKARALAGGDGRRIAALEPTRARRAAARSKRATR